MKWPNQITATNIKFIFTLLIIGTLWSCKADKEEIVLEKPVEYTLSLEPGKYIIYRLDSTVFEQAGRVEEVHSYQEKHQVDAEITDNLGRKSYRIYRYIRNINGTGSWLPSGAYTITPTDNTVEVKENNLLIIPLAGPIKQGASWRGNNYLGPEPYASLYNFSNDDNMGSWDFVIESIGETEIYNNIVVNDIVTVSHAEEIVNVPIDDKDAYASKIISYDKYAKGIGLVYQEHILWEYQPNPSGTPYQTGFGIVRSLLEHN